MKKLALILFILSFIGTVVYELTSVQWIFFIGKPLIMISLFTYYIVSVDRENKSPVFMLGLVFSFAGDVLLMNPEYFILGLVAFLLAHVMYVFAYRQHRHDEAQDDLRGLQRVRLAFPILLAGTGLVVILYPVLGDLKIPVIIYAAVITTMALNALFRYGRTSQQSFWFAFAGAILFMMSDSLLAINKFLEPIQFGGLYIMVTYMLAQWMIVQGILKHPTDA